MARAVPAEDVRPPGKGSPQAAEPRGRGLLSSAGACFQWLEALLEAAASVPLGARCGAPTPLPQREECDFERDYELTQKVLGTGKGGAVRLGVSKASAEQVAVKCFELQEMDRRRYEDMLQEITVQCAVRHPHVAGVRAVYESESEVHLVLDHLAGGDLFEALKADGPFSECAAVSAMEQLLDALAHLHAEGIVHRDVKPENLVYADAERSLVKLVDFGFAVRWDGAAPLRRYCGTERYMAPEMARRSTYTEKVDVWSAGVVAHVLLTGDLPFARPTDRSFRLSRRLGSLSAEAQDFVRALLVADPAERPGAAEALRHPWIQSHGRPRVHHGPHPLLPKGCCGDLAKLGAALSDDSSTEARSDGDSASERLASALSPAMSLP